MGIRLLNPNVTLFLIKLFLKKFAIKPFLKSLCENDLSINVVSEYMQAIEVSHLIKEFGPLTALNDITFSVNEGETFGFLGPNGAGKTTTIRILTGVSRPTSGTATIFGHDIEHE
ncbi:MAG: ATP-binding cassette domain-containing protein, partial [Methanosarcina sp.]|nr:ATP-binding cassette domain-containing protein [Methanosarcina sp.]